MEHHSASHSFGDLYSFTRVEIYTRSIDAFGFIVVLYASG